MYEPPNLFPDVGPLHLLALRDLVEQKIVETMRDGTFCMTTFACQAQRFADAAGAVFLNLEDRQVDSANGTGWNPQPRHEPLHSDIAAYRVRVGCINQAAQADDQYANRVRIKIGSAPRGIAGEKGRATLGLDGPGRQVLFRDEYVEIDGPVAELPVDLAWRALRQAGEHVVRAKRAEMQKRVWRYRELPPERKAKVRHADRAQV